MSTQPRWEAVDSEVADLLTLVADVEHPSVDFEWEHFLGSLREVAICTADGLIRPNALRPKLRGQVAPRRIGAFTNRALSQGLVEYTGEWQISDDTEGRNGGKPARVMRWIGAPS